MVREVVEELWWVGLVKSDSSLRASEFSTRIIVFRKLRWLKRSRVSCRLYSCRPIEQGRLSNESNSTAGAMTVKANLQEQFSDYLHVRKQKRW